MIMLPILVRNKKMSFVKRQFNLSKNDDAVLSLLKAQDINVCLTVDDIIANAQQRAQNILDEALEQAEHIRQQAEKEANEQALLVRQEIEQEAWRELNQLIAELNQQKEKLWDDIEKSATVVLNEALLQFMGQAEHQEKAQVLVRQLVKVQRQSHNGTLLCSPELFDSVKTVLDQQKILHWHAVTDSNLLSGEISLVTGMGSFRCSWQSLCEQLTS
jgi:type III secretion protein L